MQIYVKHETIKTDDGVNVVVLVNDEICLKVVLKLAINAVVNDIYEYYEHKK